MDNNNKTEFRKDIYICVCVWCKSRVDLFHLAQDLPIAPESEKVAQNVFQSPD